MRINNNNTIFIVFSDDWGEHPSSCQHLFRQISKKHMVLWVNTVGMRNPTFTVNDLKKSIMKVNKMLSLKYKRQVPKSQIGRPDVVQPPMLPFSNIPLIRRINRWSVVKNVQNRLNILKKLNILFVTTVPNACDFIGFFGEQRVVYYCVDDFAEWPGLEKFMVREMEEDLIRKSDIFVATSQKLYEKLSKYGKPVHLLTHGVDLVFFRKDLIDEHPMLHSIPKPRVGFYGLFDQRCDQKLLADVANRMHEISFVITGRVVVDTSLFKNLSNIYFTGSIPYSELPAMVCGWNACFLPYKINKLTESILPLKLKEYLATGKPVVSTAVPEVKRLRNYVAIAEGVDEWVKCLYISLKGVSEKERICRNSFLRNESWRKKAEQFMEICINPKGA